MTPRAAAYSERDAWGTILDLIGHAQMGFRTGHEANGLRDLKRIGEIADTMLRQVETGVHANPPIVTYGLLNPPGRIIAKRVYGIEYWHADDSVNYRHDFRRAVTMYGLKNGSVLLQEG